jgi:hypothetical protein
MPAVYGLRNGLRKRDRGNSVRKQKSNATGDSPIIHPHLNMELELVRQEQDSAGGYLYKHVGPHQIEPFSTVKEVKDAVEDMVAENSEMGLESWEGSPDEIGVEVHRVIPLRDLLNNSDHSSAASKRVGEELEKEREKID